jgi:hypothetical protein
LNKALNNTLELFQPWIDDYNAQHPGEHLTFEVPATAPQQLALF